jgi:hypothetical protein
MFFSWETYKVTDQALYRYIAISVYKLYSELKVVVKLWQAIQLESHKICFFGLFIELFKWWTYL